MHGGVQFAKQFAKPTDENLAAGEPLKRQRSSSVASDLWNWATGRASSDGDASDVDAVSEPNAVSPAIKRKPSLGGMAGLWDWGLGREEPPTSPSESRESSVHNGGSERAAAKAMPWAIKLQFGQDKERPV